MSEPQQQDAFTIERRGGLTVISATPALESVAAGLEEQAADLIFEPLRNDPEPTVVFDLSQVDYFGSVFLAVLLRCFKLVQAKGGTMALSGVSVRAKELLHLTSIDFVWPIYADRREAVEALLAD
jgi:anti-anti-sigma factor